MRYEKRANLRVSAETWERFQRVADMLDTTVSQLMRQTLDQAGEALEVLAEIGERAKVGDRVGAAALYGKMLESSAAQMEVYRELGRGAIDQVAGESGKVAGEPSVSGPAQ